MSKKEPVTKSSGNVFADLGFPAEEAENMRVRTDLMIAIKALIKENGWTQKEAARHFGVSQPRISEIWQGKIERFTVDKLINMLAHIGRQVSVEVWVEYHQLAHPLSFQQPHFHTPQLPQRALIPVPVLL